MEETASVVDLEALEATRQQHIGRLLLRAHRAFNGRLLGKLRSRGYDEKGVGLAHTSALANLDLQGTRITLLAERAGMTKQGIGQVVRDLEGRGYVERLKDPADRRAVLVRLTASGMQLLVVASEIKDEIEAEYAMLLGESGFANLKAALALVIRDEEWQTLGDTEVEPSD